MLNQDFVNVWVLNTDMKRLREKRGRANLPPLIGAIVDGWKAGSPVDSLVLSPQLELLGRHPANDLVYAGPDFAAAYRDFLQASVNGERPDLDKDIRLTYDQFSAITSEHLRQRLSGKKTSIAILMLPDDRFRVGDKGPLTRQEARAAAIDRKRELLTTQKMLHVFLAADPTQVTQDQFNAFAKTLHDDWKLFKGPFSSSFATEGMSWKHDADGEER